MEINHGLIVIEFSGIAFTFNFSRQLSKQTRNYSANVFFGLPNLIH